MPDPTRRTILKLGLTSVPATALLGDALARAAVASPTEQGQFERASICFRIGQPIWASEARFQELLDLFDAHPGVTDEVTLFTSESHPPLPLDEIMRRMPVMQARLEAARARGYRSGINILATIGHHEENLPNSLSGDFTPMTDPNGNVCRGSFCPNDPHLQEYARVVYKTLASVKPDYIWIDDDVRLFGHGPIAATCFCDTCIRLFSERQGTPFSRDSLRDALNGNAMAMGFGLRRAWLQHNHDTLSRLFTLIESTVHAVAPGMPLGFMTGDRFYEGYDFDGWASVLAGPAKAPVLWRPGGGAYREDKLDDFVDKAHAMGRQVAFLPASVQCIQSEIESFPYQRLKKSVHSTAMEASAYIAAGCTGTAFNVLSMYDEPLDEYAPLVAGLKVARPFLDLLARHLGRTPPTGVHSGWCKDTYAASNPEGPWFSGPDAPGHCFEVWATGLPAAYSPNHAPVTAWSGDSVLALTGGEVRAALTRGVLMDAPALERINAMGFGEFTGFTLEKTVHIDCIEEFTSHPLNGAFAGRRRNGRQSFYKSPAHFLRPTAAGAQAISRCVDYTYAEVAPSCMGVFENTLGGRVCVAGYYPWEQLQNLSKSSQLKSVVRWLSNDTLSAYVASFHRVNVWARESDDGQLSIVLLNAYLDPAERIEIAVRTSQEQLTFYDHTCKVTRVQVARHEDGYAYFLLPVLPPWRLALLAV